VRKESSSIVRDLARRQGESLVSCYLPFARAGKDVRQNGIQLKNCQRTLAEARETGAIDERTTSAATRELSRAAEAVDNPRAPRAAGLALFASTDECVTLEPPSPFGSFVTIAQRYYVVPLVPLTTIFPPVLVLALSRHAVRLVDRVTSQELTLPPDVPRSLTDVVGSELREPSLQHHSVGNGAVFHGHGEGNDDLQPEVEVYCRRIAHALEGELVRASATVVLAGDVQITAIFRRAAVGWPLLDEQINGNHDRTAASQLAALAGPLVAAQQSAEHAELKALYGARSAEQRASDEPLDIAAAARAGRIDTLLLEHAAALDEPRLRAARAPQSVQPEGPFNSEAVLTLRCGGDVRVLPAAHMPTPAPQAAIFRF
jgi:Bacterial archaeo-eukaryotic release factor family 7